MTSGFLSPEQLLAGGPRGLTHAVERALWHLGFSDVRLIDGANDRGADILGVRSRQQWVFQCKWKRRGLIDRTGVDDAERARRDYSADRAVVVTNLGINRAAELRRRVLADLGVQIDKWTGHTLQSIWERMPDAVPSNFLLRPYQTEAADRVEAALASSGRALLVLATGLGKTVVAGEVIRRVLDINSNARILVVGHTKELVDQLERAMWRHLTKFVPTQVLNGDSKPIAFDGVTAATIESGLRLVESGYAPDLIMIDETHHVGKTGMYADLLDKCRTIPFFGVTATPWRGDKFDISARFGEPVFTLGIAEGMAHGFLSQVDYRIFVDNLDWDFVRSQSKHGYSIKELNRALFIPQRDEEIVDEIRRSWIELREPRAIIFCQTIEHAERMADQLAGSDPLWRRAQYLHSGLGRQQRQVMLNAFRLGRVPIITCVDIFNEGVDVPDVNLIAFLRVTHSRRIFVQQLGRGLRLREGKSALRVLDFVTDLRRVAAALDLKRQLTAHQEASLEELSLPRSASVVFTDETAGSFLDHWIRDAADLETSADDVRLEFPAWGGP